MATSQRRTLRIAPERLDAAARALGTQGVTATVNAALDEVVRAHLRRELMATGFPDLDPEGVAGRRQVRVVARRPKSGRAPAARGATG